MSLNYSISKNDVLDLYNALVRSYSKNINYIASPTNEKYWNGRYQYEYTYKFCFTNGNLTLNNKNYSTNDHFTCYFFREDGLTDIKNSGKTVSVFSNQKSFSNVKFKNEYDIPKTFENIGGVYYDTTTFFIFFVAIFCMLFVFIKSIFYKIR